MPPSLVYQGPMNESWLPMPIGHGRGILACLVQFNKKEGHNVLKKTAN